MPEPLVVFRDAPEEADAEPDPLVIGQDHEPVRALHVPAFRMREVQDGAESYDVRPVEQSEAFGARMEFARQIVITAKSSPFARRAPSDVESVLRAAGRRKFRIVSVSNAQSGASHSATSR